MGILSKNPALQSLSGRTFEIGHFKMKTTVLIGVFFIAVTMGAFGSGETQRPEHHQRIRRMSRRCVDENVIDCPVWAQFGYCTHRMKRFTIWMRAHCMRSCGVCQSHVQLTTTTTTTTAPITTTTNLTTETTKLSSHTAPIEQNTTTISFSAKSRPSTADNTSIFTRPEAVTDAMTTVATTNDKTTAPTTVNSTTSTSFGTSTTFVGVLINSTETNSTKLLLKGTTEPSRTLNTAENITVREVVINGRSPTEETTTSTRTPTVINARPIAENTNTIRLQRYNEKSRESLLRNCFPTNCGLRNNERTSVDAVPMNVRKIAGGRRARKGEAPWHGMLLTRTRGNFKYCGLSVICSKWLLTAGHCVSNIAQIYRNRSVSITIYVGRYRGVYGFISRTTQVFDKFDIKDIVVHPVFTSRPRYVNDIALIKLRSAIQFNEFVHPVCIPYYNPLRQGEALIAFGWGATLGRGPSSNYLKQVELKYLPHENCQDSVWGLGRNGTFCAKGELDNDTCYGDSGGGLVRKRGNNGADVIYGITSYGTHHCNTRRPLAPSVYTDVAFYREWIESVTNGCCDT
uniref:ovochymase-1-like n=1 Tax=Ciona intestinalis TaxID=7719 RepID=UPI0005216CB2|nr:ovochymase-1-like [Ciona intestinalis]|eukprot:XP_009861051.1 ovochymase-1-like [Ciona intestinalis]